MGANWPGAPSLGDAPPQAPTPQAPTTPTTTTPAAASPFAAAKKPAACKWKTAKMAVAAVGRIRAKPAQASAPAAFASSLRDALSSLGGAEMLFVRCFLPHPVGAPPRAARAVDARFLERQLQSSAVLPAALP